MTVILTGYSYADELITYNDFDPIPLEENSLTDKLLGDINNKAGIAVSSAGAFAGLSFAIANTYSVLDYSLNNPGTGELSEKIILTGTLIITTAFFSLLLDYFISGV